MAKFAIAFISSRQKKPLIHRVIESENKDSALRTFFDEEATSFYSNNDQGFFYFKEDFTDPANTQGSIITLD